MRLDFFGFLLCFVAVVKCDDQFHLLNELKSLDLIQSIQQILTANPTDLDDAMQSDHKRNYDWNKCIIELNAIADGWNRTELWAIRCKYS